MLYLYVREDYESLDEESQELTKADPSLFVSNNVPNLQSE